LHCRKPARPPGLFRAIEAEDACGRFTARVLRDVTIGDSRDWFAGAEVSTYFALLEQKQISNAVDATNFAWLAMGQPTHVFDLDKIEGGIVVRRARKGERLKTLDGVERVLDPEDLVVADHVKALGLAGRDGRLGHDDYPATTNVLVEAAWFDPMAVRRTARRHGLHTDASHRFERGADFNAAPVASALVSSILLASGGWIEGELVDVRVAAHRGAHRRAQAGRAGAQRSAAHSGRDGGRGRHYRGDG
jgi:phenylalanyl-tRNA synthetase beta chain